MQWALAEMLRRYNAFADRGAKDITRYNDIMKMTGEPILPYLVVIIDELADPMMASPREVEDSICRIAQMGRACGIHLVVATQRPSVDVITGLIKANFLRGLLLPFPAKRTAVQFWIKAGRKSCWAKAICCSIPALRPNPSAFKALLFPILRWRRLSTM